LLGKSGTFQRGGFFVEEKDSKRRMGKSKLIASRGRPRKRKLSQLPE